MVLRNYFYLIIIICLHIVVWFHVTNNNSKKVKLASLVEGDLKALFSIATIPKCRGGRCFFPWIAPLYS